jgi:hypothetical protein
MVFIEVGARALVGVVIAGAAEPLSSLQPHTRHLLPFDAVRAGVG